MLIRRVDSVPTRRPIISPPVPMPGWLWSGLRRVTGVDRLEALYRQLPSDIEGIEFARQALKKLGVEWSTALSEVEAIPLTGGVVIAANHPYGGIDGLAAIIGIASRRPDLKVIATRALAGIPALKAMIIPVDNFGVKEARGGNIKAVREALRHVKSGGALLMFPAGEVAHLELSSRQVVDPAWKKAAVGLMLAAGAPVVPLYVHGSNSIGFHLAGLLHPSLRTLLLPREVTNKRGSKLDLRFGSAISNDRLRACGHPQRTEQLVKVKLYSLAAPRVPDLLTKTANSKNRTFNTEIDAARSPQLLIDEVDGLHNRARLLAVGSIDIFIAQGSTIPNLLHEIGRLREITFRAVGEGTGSALDLDRFDRFYEHLIAWDRKKKCVIGAYRLARVDEVRRRYGRTSLYLNSLFDFRDPFHTLLGPALELGRSFIRPEYQRSYVPLLALWRGIAEYISQNPRYSKLIGPVSVSADYDEPSRDLMVRYLRWHHLDPVLGALAKPRSPYRPFRSLAVMRRSLLQMQEIDDLSPLLSMSVENHTSRAVSVPVLLRQYLKLGGRVLSFNVDESFGHCVDCLTLVDLCQTPDEVLSKYMDESGLRRFRDYHANSNLIKTARFLHRT
jgi:putative hemolysin